MLDKYSLELANVSTRLLKFMANNLGVDQDALLGTFDGQPQSVRINYYPPCREADKVLGLSPHTDGIGTTFLLHVNDVHGLQIKKGGKWFSVESIPGALVVNIGDVLEVHLAIFNFIRYRENCLITINGCFNVLRNLS
jgi:isopenicillin N synthase-like dioxygenase